MRTAAATRAVPLLVLFLGMAAPALPAEGVDLVVMVDTSESMFPFFDDLVEYLIRDLLAERLTVGDSFHLLSFASSPELEMDLGIEAGFSVDKAIGRILLLQPLGPYTDLVSAVQFLYAFTKTLPERNPKTILLLTDGVHDPPPGSPYFGWDSARVRSELLASAREIRREGWSVHILQIPGAARIGLPQSALPEEEAFSAAQEAGPGRVAAAPAAAAVSPGAPAGDRPAQRGPVPGGAQEASPPPAPAGGTAAVAVPGTGAPGAGVSPEPSSALLEEMARTLNTEVVPYSEESIEQISSLTTGLPLLQFPGDLGKVGRLFLAPFRVRNFRNEPIILRLTGVRTEVAGRKADLLARRVTVTVPPGEEASFQVPVRLPSTLAEGPAALEVELDFSDDSLRVSPRHGTLRFSYVPGVLAVRLRLVTLLYAALAALALFILIRLLLLIRLRMETKPAAPFRRAISAGRTAGQTRPLLMSIFFRDFKMSDKTIRTIRPGACRSVGGRGASFPVHVIPLPRRVAEIANENHRYVFRPKKPRHLPGVEAPIADCLGRPIDLESARGRRVRLVFQEYVPPLEEINRLMLSIRRWDTGGGKAPPAGTGQPPSEPRAATKPPKAKPVRRAPGRPAAGRPAPGRSAAGRSTAAKKRGRRRAKAKPKEVS